MSEQFIQTNYEPARFKLILDSISNYRQLLDDEIISRFYELVSCTSAEEIQLSQFINLYNDFYYALTCSSTNTLKDYIIDKIIFSETPYSHLVESGANDQMTSSLGKAVANDLVNLQLISEVTSSDIKDYVKKYFSESKFEYGLIENLPEWVIRDEYCGGDDKYPEYVKAVEEKFYKTNAWNECVQVLTEFYNKYGCGVFARYKAFVWESYKDEGYLKGIDNPDPVILADLIGYDVERSKVIKNTLQFLDGFQSNNVLLYGDRGTGKSSTVKALLNEYYLQGLRMIEVPKANLSDFPSIIRLLKNRPQKFIIFVDDLAFEDNEESYTALKSVLEGGLESRPSNILIYATSNRRHLIKEYFHEREGLQSGNQNEEIHAADSIQEKLSLADRFGITAVFISPTKYKYLEIVDGIAEQRKLNIDKEQLHREALQWEMKYNGKSPRTARQFIDWIEGHVAIEDK